MKIVKSTKICATLLLFLLLINHSKITYATPEGRVYHQHVIYVNEQRFELWGYGFWDGYGNYRLRDIAYILNGTSAQFDIREPLGEHLHFWIERNVPYVPIGTELNYLYEEHRERRTIGTFHAYAVEHFPLQDVILSLDGLETPDANVVVTVLTSFGFPLNEPQRLADLNQVYFDIKSFAGLLGFSSEFKPGALHITTGAEYLTDNIESQPLDILDISLRLTGHWVDRRFFDSVIINQEVAWPHEFEIGLFGLTYHPRFVDFQFTGVPLAARQPNVWQYSNQIFYPFIMGSLADGIMTISVDGLDRSISADLSSMPVNTLTYYVGGIPHEMVRLDPNRSPGRYHYEALEEGGILFTYIADFQSFWGMPEYIHIYRSTVQGYDGERILTHAVIDENDRIFFEFTDPYAEPGKVYFYTIKAQDRRERYYIITFGREPQITAYIEYIPDDAPTIEADAPETAVVENPEPPEHAAYTQPDSGRYMVALKMIIGVLVVIVVLFIVRRKMLTSKIIIR